MVGPGKNVALDYQGHMSGDRELTEAVMVKSLRRHHPDLCLTVISPYRHNLRGFAAAGNATCLLDEDVVPILSTGSSHGEGKLSAERYSKPLFAKYDYLWQDYHYILYEVFCMNSEEPYTHHSFVLSAPCGKERSASFSSTTSKLMDAISEWANKSDNEIWCFDNGNWYKSEELFQSIQTCSWEDVILDSTLKDALMSDILGFFSSETTYKRFGVAWKRGIIFHGSPGNGKTITCKAVMNSLSAREPPLPMLYVKTFLSSGGPQYGVQAIFQKARELAPCLLIFEDLDSLVTDEVRSYFLNEVDGMANNNGILIIGSTNHLDKLDPAIVKRPSRFDRKFPFRSPTLPERRLYAEYWLKRKIDKLPEIAMSEADADAVAKCTSGFTFAYLQEAFVSTLFAIFKSRTDDKVCREGPDSSKSEFMQAFEAQVKTLKDQMVDKDGDVEDEYDAVDDQVVIRKKKDGKVKEVVV